MRRFAPIILVALIASGVVLLTTTTGRQQAAPEAPSSATLFPDLAGDELRKALHDYAAAGHDPLSYRRAREIVYWHAKPIVFRRWSHDRRAENSAGNTPYRQGPASSTTSNQSLPSS